MDKIEQTLSTSYDHMKAKASSNHMTIRNHKSVNQVDGIVARLTAHFHNDSHTPLFRRAGWYLSEAAIFNAVEASGRANSPIAYFITCIKRELHKVGK